MKVFCMLVLVLINENGSVTGTTLCCSLDQVESEEFYPTRESADESITTDDLTEIAENFTSQENAPLEVKPNQTSRLCGSTEVTNVYERKHDIDMRYVQDSITALWRIIFFLIFILILLVFLISYVSSLIRRSNSKGCSPSRTKMYAEVGIRIDKTPQLYFPAINGSRTANFLKDLDPIYDYPCSLQSDYEKV